MAFPAAAKGCPFGAATCSALEPFREKKSAPIIGAAKAMRESQLWPI
jgi:hypothetical protein